MRSGREHVRRRLAPASKVPALMEAERLSGGDGGGLPLLVALEEGGVARGVW